MADDWSIEPIRKDHDRADFVCGHPGLDEFLLRFARQNEEKGFSRTYVGTRPGELRVLGFFSLSSGSVATAMLPEQERRKLPRYPVPVVPLGRLAVDRSVRGRGLGEALLLKAFRVAIEVSGVLGVYAIEVLAKDDGARGFYERYGFRTLLDDPHHLYLSIRTVRKALGG